MFYHLPPTAYPVAARDFINGFSGLITKKKYLDLFRVNLNDYLNINNCFFLSSGRSALNIILTSLKELTIRKKVILPAYTCPTVVQSILSADLEPVFCDVSPVNLSFDTYALKKLFLDDIIAIIPTYLYGIVHDISDISRSCVEKDTFLIEDAAQALGSRSSGHLSGDFEIYSLGRGKCLPTGSGGIIVTKDRYASLIQNSIEKLNLRSANFDLIALLRLFGFFLATTPFGWWFINHSPANPADTGMEVNKLPPIEHERFSSVQAGIGGSMLRRIDKITSIRRRNAYRLMDIASSVNYLSFPKEFNAEKSVFLRFPIVVDTKDRSEILFNRLSKAGIGVSRSYNKILPDLYPEINKDISNEYPGAVKLAECLLTLPTHHYLRDEDFKSIDNIITP